MSESIVPPGPTQECQPVSHGHADVFLVYVHLQSPEVIFRYLQGCVLVLEVQRAVARALLMVEQFDHGIELNSRAIHDDGRSDLVVKALYFSGLARDQDSRGWLAALQEPVVPRCYLGFLISEDRQPRHGKPGPSSSGIVPDLAIDGKYVQVRSCHAVAFRVSPLHGDAPSGGALARRGDVQVPRRKASNSGDGGTHYQGTAPARICQARYARDHSAVNLSPFQLAAVKVE